MIESTWNADKKEVLSLLETLDYNADVEWDNIDEDDFFIIKHSNGLIEIMDSSNRFLYSSGIERT
jgi:hypothetical protein